jgi:hypothetical protein
MNTPTIDEQLLYYLWRLKRFDLDDLKTTQGEPLQILDAGIRNSDSGPDFHLARIRIGTQTWIGHVEMHVKSSDWYRHQHQDDPAFENVILHVVYEHDKEVTLPNNESLACLSLKARLDVSLIQFYQELMQTETWIPCARHTFPLDVVRVTSWYERVLVERLERKTLQVQEMLEQTENDWEETMYRLLARNFGFNVNSEPFERLARATPRRILMKHKDKLHQLEALLFGQSGLLPNAPIDLYTEELAEEYIFLSKKYNLTPLEAHHWKFMRMRPANFPTIRLAQFILLFYKTEHLFSKMLAARSAQEIRQMFVSEVSWYWKTHYRFGEPSAKRSRKLGRASVDLIIINTIVPLLFHYGQYHQENKYKDRALAYLQELKSESNRTIRQYQTLDFPVNSAFDSQALLQLKKYYCDKKRCLDCSIGHALLRESPGG